MLCYRPAKAFLRRAHTTHHDGGGESVDVLWGHEREVKVEADDQGDGR